MSFLPPCCTHLELVNWINTLESESIDKVSFYKLTKQFAETLKQDPQFSSVQVTGHSLGGGLAMITGAQAKIPAVGLSGPNALISGKSFNPEVTAEDMNKVRRKCVWNPNQLGCRVYSGLTRCASCNLGMVVYLQHCSSPRYCAYA
jgi:putative lipase involved disintegration of autophagic bodies